MAASRVLVEVCVDGVDSALAAEAGGADRIELCDNLLEGGTTPSAGMIATCCARLSIPVFVMIRPRGGAFSCSEAELEVMRRDVEEARRLGAAGVVIGLLTADGEVDVARTRELVELARPLPVTFHRAFDSCRDPGRALDDLLATGVERVLSSGFAPTAEQGIPVLRGMVERAAGRLRVMAGAGVRAGNAPRIVRETGVREVHFRAAVQRPSGVRYMNPAVAFRSRTSLPEDVLEVTDRHRVAEVVAAVHGL